jgi:carbon storage regulator
MLVLSRRLGESVVISDDITITVVDIRGDKVRLGIDAPLDVSVDRLEVREAKDREKGQGLEGAIIRNAKRLGLRKPEGNAR